MKNLKGFTLTEMIVTIIIVITLSTISVPIYRGYVANAKLAEGYALLAAIRAAQESYYNQHGYFLDDMSATEGISSYTCNEEIFGINARTNKYYSVFYWNTRSVNSEYYLKRYFIAYVNGSNLTKISMVYDMTAGVTYLFGDPDHPM